MLIWYVTTTDLVRDRQHLVRNMHCLVQERQWGPPRSGLEDKKPTQKKPLPLQPAAEQARWELSDRQDVARERDYPVQEGLDVLRERLHAVSSET